VDEDGLPHLRNSLRQRSARIAQVSPSPRLIEGPQLPPVVPTTAPRFSFWRFSLRAVPIIAAIASTSVLAYVLISERLQPQIQLQQPQQQVAQTPPQQPQAQAQSPVQEPPPQRPAQIEVQEPDPPVPIPLPPMPSDDKLVILINSALIALNQANATDNYTVLRDMAAPAFKRVNSPERLAQVFTNLRNRNLDLSPFILFQPQLYQKPEMNDKGMVRVTGFFPTTPERLNFQMIFQPVQGRWRLFAIAANTVPAPAPQAAPAQPATSPAEPQAAKSGVPTKKKPGEKPKASEETEAKPQVDIRDRIDNPPSPAEPPSPVAPPKQKSLWNPFGQ